MAEDTIPCGNRAICGIFIVRTVGVTVCRPPGDLRHCGGKPFCWFDSNNTPADRSGKSSFRAKTAPPKIVEMEGLSHFEKIFVAKCTNWGVLTRGATPTPQRGATRWSAPRSALAGTRSPAPKSERSGSQSLASRSDDTSRVCWVVPEAEANKKVRRRFAPER